MIKNNFLLSLLASTFLLQVSGQTKCPVKKVYAYKQTSLPGVNPKSITNPDSERKETFNYWIYLSMPASKTVSINNIWISGQKFSVKSEEVQSTPVNKIYNDPGAENKTIELVPKTKHKLILVYPSGIADNNELSAKARRKIEKNELVIDFTWKTKKRFARKKLIRILPPEILP